LACDGQRPHIYAHIDIQKHSCLLHFPGASFDLSLHLFYLRGCLYSLMILIPVPSEKDSDLQGLKVCVFVFSNTTTMTFSFCLNQIMHTVFWSGLACLICIAKKSIKHIFFRMYYDCTWYIKLVVAHSLDNGGTCLFCADKFNAFAEYVIVYLI